MSNQVHLYVSNLTSAQEVIDDDLNEGNQQEALLQVQGDVPALLWIPLFRDVEWQEVIDKEQFEEDEEADPEDYTFKIPVQTIEKAINNLRESEKHLSQYFEENGGVKEIMEDLIEVLKKSKMKYVVFNPMCGDFHYSEESDRELVEDVLKIASGDMSIDKEYIASRFNLKLKNKKLFSSKPILFEKFSENLFDSSKTTQLINVFSLIGDVSETL